MDKTSSNPQRVDVITSVERRRKWAAAEKKAVIEETYKPGMLVSYVAENMVNKRYYDDVEYCSF